MISIPKDINSLFKEILDQESINVKHHSYYLKWLRYYYDFCHKYKHPVEEQSSLPHFTNKLQEKNQKEFQIRQAIHAVNLYYKILLRNKPMDNKALLNKDSLCSQVKSPQPKKDNLPVTPMVDQKSKVYEMENHKEQTSGMISDNGDCMVAESSSGSVAKSSIPVQLASWVSAYNDLKSEIKVRHYSSKTLKSYKAWMHKFQTYTKSKPLELLSDSDIKKFLCYLAEAISPMRYLPPDPQ